MKVQRDGLLLDLRTTNPPGPFSPLKAAPAEREKVTEVSSLTGWLTGGGVRPDEAAARGLAFVDGCHASRHVAVALPFHPSHINKVPEKRETEREQ